MPKKSSKATQSAKTTTERKIKLKEKDESSSGTAGYLGSSQSKKVIKRYQQQAVNKRWWVGEKKDLHISVDATVGTIESAQTNRRMQNIRFSRMYGNWDATGFQHSNLMKSSPDSSSNNRVSLNIIQSVIDAVAAKVAKDKPKVSFITSGADDYFLKLRAQYLTKYMQGLFEETNLYEKSNKVFRDSEVLGTGALHIFIEDDKIKCDWVFMDELRVDELDGIKQEPRSMHRVKLVPRDLLMTQFPEYVDKIISAHSAVTGRIAYNSTVDVVKVIESWHLPADDKSDDGVHCITIENCTLFEEDYKKDYFPIVFFRWYDRPLGFFGRSITEEILTIQVEINKILRTIQQSQELAATPMIFVENSSQISEDVLLSNTIARMIPYSGMPPTWLTPTAQNPEVYQHLNSLIQWAFQVVGLSQTSASGMKPSGVDSAVAIREVADIETSRFAIVATSWEKWFVNCARVMVDLSKDLYKDYPDLAVNFTEKKIIRNIKWKDVDLEDNPFDIQTFPVSQLPDTPAGRIQTISEYVQNQWITKERAMELMNLDPDLEQDVNIQTSSLRLCEKWLSEMVEDGVSHRPEPFMNLQLMQTLAQGVYTMLVHDNCPEDRLQLVRMFINDCTQLQTPPPQPAQPQPAPPAGPQTAPAGSMNPIPQGQ